MAAGLWKKAKLSKVSFRNLLLFCAGIALFVFWPRGPLVPLLYRQAPMLTIEAHRADTPAALMDRLYAVRLQELLRRPPPPQLLIQGPGVATGMPDPLRQNRTAYANSPYLYGGQYLQVESFGNLTIARLYFAPGAKHNSTRILAQLQQRIKRQAFLRDAPLPEVRWYDAFSLTFSQDLSMQSAPDHAAWVPLREVRLCNEAQDLNGLRIKAQNGPQFRKQLHEFQNKSRATLEAEATLLYESQVLTFCQDTGQRELWLHLDRRVAAPGLRWYGSRLPLLPRDYASAPGLQLCLIVLFAFSCAVLLVRARKQTHFLATLIRLALSLLVAAMFWHYRGLPHTAGVYFFPMLMFWSDTFWGGMFQARTWSGFLRRVRYNISALVLAICLLPLLDLNDRLLYVLTLFAFVGMHGLWRFAGIGRGCNLHKPQKYKIVYKIIIPLCGLGFLVYLLPPQWSDTNSARFAPGSAAALEGTSAAAFFDPLSGPASFSLPDLTGPGLLADPVQTMQLFAATGRGLFVQDERGAFQIHLQSSHPPLFQLKKVYYDPRLTYVRRSSGSQKTEAMEAAMGHRGSPVWQQIYWALLGLWAICVGWLGSLAPVWRRLRFGNMQATPPDPAIR